MSISSIEELMATARKDRLDPVESEALYLKLQGHCRDFQRNKIKAEICFHLIERYELYKIDGAKDTRALLKSWGFSDGAISHGMAFGEFCCMMKFKDDQIPPEYAVRSLLVRELKSEWGNIYRAACTLSLKKHVMSEVEMSSGESSAAKNSTEDDADDEQASENESDTPKNTTAAEEAPSQSNECDSEGDGEDGGGDDGEEDEPLNENSLPLLDQSAAPDTLLDSKPTIAELKQAIREYKKRDQANIHLFSIHEKVPREGDFASAVLGKFKKKLTTVSVLCQVVNDYKSAGGNLTEEDTSAIRDFRAEIHDREAKKLESAISGVSPDDDNGEDSVNEEPEE